MSLLENELRRMKEVILNNCKETKQHRLVNLNKRVTVTYIKDINFDDINERNEYGITALQLAAIENRSDVIESLLKIKGVLINRASGSNTDRNTALHFAAKFSNEDALAALLKNADINVRVKNNSNKTASDLILENQLAKFSAIDMQKNKILSQCRKDRKNTELHNVILLTKNDIDHLNKSMLQHINEKNKCGLTPLHLAAIKNLPELVKCMLHEDELDITLKFSCEYNLTAEEFANRFGSFEVMDVFYNIAATVFELNDAMQQDSKMKMTIPESKMKFNMKPKAGGTKKLWSLRKFYSRRKFLKNMYAENASSRERTNENSLNTTNAPMELCIFNNRIDLANILSQEESKPYPPLLSETLKCPCIWLDAVIAKIYFKAAMTSDLTTIALHSMVNGADENKSFVTQLLKKFCNCTDKSTTEHSEHLVILNTRLNILYREEPVFGETLVEKYILNNNIDIAEMIMKMGANKPAIGFLFKLLEQPGESVAKFTYVFHLFVLKSIDKEKRKTTGLTLLHKAISCNKIQAVKFMLSQGFDINKRAPDVVSGYTPLHQAVFQGNLEAVNLLIESNADDSLKVYSYKPFEIALLKTNERWVYSEIMQKLFESNIEKDCESAADLLKTVINTKLFYDDYKHIMKRMLKAYFKSDKCRQSGRKHHKIFDHLFNEFLEHGDYKVVEYFLQAGIRPKHAALRYLIQHSVDEPQKMRQIKNVYRLIVKYAVNLCSENSVNKYRPFTDDERRKLTIVELLNERFCISTESKKKITVMEFACSIQAVDMIEEILNTKGVFKETKFNADVYLVTNLVPDTCRVINKNKKNSVVPSKQEDMLRNCFVGANFHLPDSFDNQRDYESCDDNNDDDVESEDTKTNKDNFEHAVNLWCTSPISFLQLLIESSRSVETDHRIAQLLIKEPLRSLTQNLFSKYREFHVYLFFLHALYMILATIYLRPTNETSPMEHVLFQNYCFGTNSSDIPLNHAGSSMRIFCFVVWFFWPVFIICLEIMGIVPYLFTIDIAKRLACRGWDVKRDGWRSDKMKESDSTCSKIVSYIKHFLRKRSSFYYVFNSVWDHLAKYFSSIFSLLFAFLALSWLAIYFISDCSSVNMFRKVTEVVIVVGWINTLNYISVIFTSINRLLVMLRKIFAEEFPTFFIVYVFFYIGFGFSIEPFNILQSEEIQDSTSMIFSSMFGIANFGQDSNSILHIESGFNLEKGFIYVYIGITFLVLSNLLIAMINQSYTEINQVSTLYIQLRFELIKKMLVLSKIFPSCLAGKTTFSSYRIATFGSELSYDDKSEQYLLSFLRDTQSTSKQDVSGGEKIKFNADEINKKIARTDDNIILMNIRLNNIQMTLETITKKLYSLKDGGVEKINI